MHFNSLVVFYFLSHCSLIMETLKKKKKGGKSGIVDINRPPLAEYRTTVQCVSIWTVICFSLFWPFSSTVFEKKQTMGLKC